MSNPILDVLIGEILAIVATVFILVGIHPYTGDLPISLLFGITLTGSLIGATCGAIMHLAVRDL
jgi:hypothetical protein